LPIRKPKAYLNWILLDEQFNYVGGYPQSGAIPLGNFEAGTLGTPGRKLMCLAIEIGYWGNIKNILLRSTRRKIF
jgi:hypothetical protein